MTVLTSIQIQALVRDMDASMRQHKRLKQSDPTEYRNKIVEANKALYEAFLKCIWMEN